MSTAERYAAYETALNRAYAAADAAQAGLVEDMNALDCGYAWVTVSDRAFAGWCRKKLNATGDLRYGDKHWRSGWNFWGPGNFKGQSIGIKEVGAKAFRDVIAQELGIYAEMGSRLD